MIKLEDDIIHILHHDGANTQNAAKKLSLLIEDVAISYAYWREDTDIIKDSSFNYFITNIYKQNEQ